MIYRGSTLRWTDFKNLSNYFLLLDSFFMMQISRMTESPLRTNIVSSISKEATNTFIAEFNDIKIMKFKIKSPRTELKNVNVTIVNRKFIRRILQSQCLGWVFWRRSNSSLIFSSLLGSSTTRT